MGRLGVAFLSREVVVPSDHCSCASPGFIMSSIDNHATGEVSPIDDDEWFRTPPTSRYQSSASLASSAKSVYLSALDLLDGADEMDIPADDVERGGPSQNGEAGKTEIYYSPLGGSDEDERHDANDDPYHVSETAPLTKTEVVEDAVRKVAAPEVGSNEGVCDCCCLMCSLHHRAKQVINSKWQYLICALKCSDLNCPNYDKLGQDELFSWLDNHKEGDNNIEFVQRCYRSDKPWCNTIQKEQSQLFFFFFLLVRDIYKLSACDNGQDVKHETYPHHDSFLNWMQELEHVLEILLQASFTHVDSSDSDLEKVERPYSVLLTIKETHKKKDYIGISFEDSGLDPAVDEIKILQRKLAGTPTTLQKVFATGAIIMFLADIGTDVFQVVTFYKEGISMWPLMLFFVIAPSLLSSVLCFYQICKEKTTTKKDKNLRRLGMVLVSLQLGQVWRNICEICDRYPIVDSYIVLSLLIIKMIEGLLEGGPQSLIQTYVLLDHPVETLTFTNILKILSPILSSISMAAALTDLDLGRAGYCMPTKAKILSVLCRLGEVWGRFLAYAVCFSAFGYYGFILFGVQCLLLTIPTYIALRRDHTENSSQQVNCVYLRCRYGGFYQEKPTKLFTAKLPRLIVWLCITMVYSFVPIQRFELDMEFNLTQSSRPPFWKCSRLYGLYNVIYALHMLVNIIAFTLWVTIGGGPSQQLFIPICVMFILGTVVSTAFRMQSWMGRTYKIALRPGFGPPV